MEEKINTKILNKEHLAMFNFCACKKPTAITVYNLQAFWNKKYGNPL